MYSNVTQKCIWENNIIIENCDLVFTSKCKKKKCGVDLEGTVMSDVKVGNS